MKTIRDYKLLLIKKGEIKKVLTLKNYYDEELKMFDFPSMKKQLYANPKLNGIDYVTYGKDYKVISAVFDNNITDFQGYKDWAVVKRYITNKDGKLLFETKKLLRRYKDIERAELKLSNKKILEKTKSR